MTRIHEYGNRTEPLNNQVYVENQSLLNGKTAALDMGLGLRVLLLIIVIIIAVTTIATPTLLAMLCDRLAL